MIFAVSTMDPTLAFVCFLVAVILFVVAFVLTRSFVALGLAFFAVVFAWNALAAT